MVDMSANIYGQVNLFNKMLTEHDANVIGVYIRKGDDLDDYMRILGAVKCPMLFCMDGAFTKEERSHNEDVIRDVIPTEKIMFVKQESYRHIIEFACMKRCKLIYTYHEMDNFIREACFELEPTVFACKSRRIDHVCFTNLQMLIEQTDTSQL